MRNLAIENLIQEIATIIQEYDKGLQDRECLEACVAIVQDFMEEEG